MPTLGDRARGILDDLDTGCAAAETRHDVEAVLADLVALGIADVAVERGDLVISLDTPAVAV